MIATLPQKGSLPRHKAHMFVGETGEYLENDSVCGYLFRRKSDGGQEWRDAGQVGQKVEQAAS